MSAPRILIQILIVGGQILGRALLAAGKQAAQNAKHRPAALQSETAAGVGHANSGSVTDVLTREHRMTLDEAHLILNIKRGTEMEGVLRNCEHLFKANSPPAPPSTGTGTGTGSLPRPNRQGGVTPYTSHYLLSKVVRARERIEAEMKVTREAPSSASEARASSSSSNSQGGGGN